MPIFGEVRSRDIPDNPSPTLLIGGSDAFGTPKPSTGWGCRVS